MYYNGNGVPKDDVQAYAWFSVARANGLNESKAALLDI
jgi:TPR repeat protein